MTRYCGIYGYECTQVISLDAAEIRPRYRVRSEAHEKARDKSVYSLTAVLVGDDIDDEMAFQLEAVLSFIEHLDVIVSSPKELDGTDIFEAFPASLPTHGRHDGGGAVLMVDWFSPDSRSNFIKSCLTHLQDKARRAQTLFADLLFKKVETFRQRRPLLEVSYFLLFSGLEAHARALTGDYNNRNAADPISKLLQSYGFDVSVERPADLKRAMSTYTHLRNALFHNSKLEAQVNINGTTTTLRLLDYYAHFLILVSLVVLKSAPFDDGHINWNGWIDQQLFQ